MTPDPSPLPGSQRALDEHAATPGTGTGRGRAGSDAEPGRQPTTGTAGENARRTGPLPGAAAFWLVAGAWFLLLFAAAAPSPLYGVYQARWRFSAITLTAVFGVYALGLLVALLVFGSVSDYLGRRRVISAALAAGAGACGLFLAAHGVGLLFAARALTGTAVAGAGFGTGFFLGAFRILALLAGPGQRAGLIAAIWIVFFLAFSVPVVIAGVAATHFGLHRTSLVYCAVIAALAAAAVGSLIIRRHSAQVPTPPTAQVGPR